MNREKVKQWIIDNDAKDGVIRAYYAYGDRQDYDNYIKHPQSHMFRDDVCVKCGETRWNIRWENSSPRCKYVPMEEVQETIKGEEEKYLKLIKKARVDIPKLVKEGKPDYTLLWETYGYHKDIVDEILKGENHDE